MSETRQLIIQAARELELEGLEVQPDLEAIGSYVVKWEGHQVNVPMAADFKGIIRVLKDVNSGSRRDGDFPQARPQGYYWIKVGGEWEVARFSEWGNWEVAGEDSSLWLDQIEAIGPKVEPPSVEPGASDAD